jgi:enoyl-CoA hydratase/carnithine racemase
MGNVVLLTLNRPEVRNAVDEELARSFAAAVRQALDEASAICLRGAGPVFCSGGDLAALKDDDDRALAVMTLMRQTLSQLRGAPIPVIAYVEGIAVGGGAEIAASAHLVCATPGAAFQFLQASVGLSPGWGGGAALAQRVGHGRALDLLLTARRIGVAEARSLGLVDRVLIPADLPAYLQQPAFQDRRLASAVVASLRGDPEGAERARREFERLWRGAGHRDSVARFLGGK